MTEPWERMMAEAVEGETTARRKLTFHTQCGIFAALYGGCTNRVIARAFDLSSTTVSLISGCLERDPDPYRLDTEAEAVHPKHGYKLGYLTGRKVKHDHNARRNPNRLRHYQDVRREFEALGADEFTRRYFTQAILDRIVIAKEQLRLDRRAKRPTHIWKDPRP
jgi:hypothetical protein